MRYTENPVTSLSAIRSMDPYDFEQLVAKVWDAQGYKTKVRPESNDKGVDIEVIGGNHKILIQAKRYSANNKIGGPDVRRYATLYQQDPTANQVIIVTTSSFTSQAKEIAAEQNVLLVDGYMFIDMMNEYNVGLNRDSRNTTSSRYDSSRAEYDETEEKIENIITSAVLAVPVGIILFVVLGISYAIIFRPPAGEAPIGYILLFSYFVSMLFIYKLSKDENKETEEGFGIVGNVVTIIIATFLVWFLLVIVTSIPVVLIFGESAGDAYVTLLFIVVLLFFIKESVKDGW